MLEIIPFQVNSFIFVIHLGSRGRWLSLEQIAANVFCCNSQQLTDKICQDGLINQIEYKIIKVYEKSLINTLKRFGIISSDESTDLIQLSSLDIFMNNFTSRSKFVLFYLLIRQLRYGSSVSSSRKRVLSSSNKKIIASKQKWCCSICNDILPSRFEVDHIIPWSKGGSDFEENLQALCPNCHSKKTERDHIEEQQNPFRSPLYMQTGFPNRTPGYNSPYSNRFNKPKYSSKNIHDSRLLSISSDNCSTSISNSNSKNDLNLPNSNKFSREVKRSDDPPIFNYDCLINEKCSNLSRSKASITDELNLQNSSAFNTTQNCLSDDSISSIESKSNSQNLLISTPLQSPDHINKNKFESRLTGDDISKSPKNSNSHFIDTSLRHFNHQENIEIGTEKDLNSKKSYDDGSHLNEPLKKSIEFNKDSGMIFSKNRNEKEMNTQEIVDFNMNEKYHNESQSLDSPKKILQLNNLILKNKEPEIIDIDNDSDNFENNDMNCNYRNTIKGDSYTKNCSIVIDLDDDDDDDNEDGNGNDDDDDVTKKIEYCLPIPEENHNLNNTKNYSYSEKNKIFHKLNDYNPSVEDGNYIRSPLKCKRVPDLKFNSSASTLIAKGQRSIDIYSSKRHYRSPYYEIPLFNEKKIETYDSSRVDKENLMNIYFSTPKKKTDFFQPKIHKDLGLHDLHDVSV